MPFSAPVTPSTATMNASVSFDAVSVFPSPKIVPLAALTRNSPLPSLSISYTASLSECPKPMFAGPGLELLVFELLGPISMRHMNVPSALYASTY